MVEGGVHRRRRVGRPRVHYHRVGVRKSTTVHKRVSHRKVGRPRVLHRRIGTTAHRRVGVHKRRVGTVARRRVGTVVRRRVVHKRVGATAHRRLATGKSELASKTVVQLRRLAKSKGIPQSHMGITYKRSALIRALSGKSTHKRVRRQHRRV